MHKRLTILLLLLLIQIAAWGWLSFSMPVLEPISFCAWDQHICVLYAEYQDRPTQSWNNRLEVDPQVRRWTNIDSIYDARWTSAAIDRPTYWRLKSSTPSHAIFERIDSRTRRALATRELSLTQQFRIIDGRFLVADTGRVQWLDLDDPHSELQLLRDTSLARMNSGLLSQPWPLPTKAAIPIQRIFNQLVDVGADRFLAVGPGTKVCEVGLFKFGEDGLPLKLAEWPLLMPPWGQEAVGVFGGCVATVQPSTGNIEVRLASDGNLQRVINFPLDFAQFPSGVSSSFQRQKSWHMYKEFFYLDLPGKSEFFHLPSGKWLRLPPECVRIHSHNCDTNLSICVAARYGTVIYDQQQGRTLFTLPNTDWNRVRILDRDTTVVAETKEGIRFNFYDTQTGRYLRTYAPFRHIPWLIAGLTLAYLLWAVQWTKVSAELRMPPWLDVCLIFGTPLILLSWRVTQGPTTEFGRLVFSYSLAMSIGVMTLCCLWLLLANRRWLIRLLPLLLFEAFLLADFRYVFGDQFPQIGSGLISVNLPAGILMLVLLLMMLPGVRWHQVSSKGQVDMPAQAEREPTRLSDFFVLTIAVAVVLGAASTTTAGLMKLNIYVPLTDLLSFAIGVAWASLTLFCCFSSPMRREECSPTRRVGKCSADAPRRLLPSAFSIMLFVQSIALCLILAEAIHRFETSVHLESTWRHVVTTRHILGAGVAVCMGCWPFRWRGYRWTRRFTLAGGTG